MNGPMPSNPTVEYLNSLRTQEHGTNPSYVDENRRAFLDQLRAAHEWFPSDEALHISTRLDDLVDSIVKDTVPVDLVFLTGDAGDGKTAVCSKIAARMRGAGDLEPVDEIGNWTLIKDASEIPEDDLRARIISQLEGRQPGTRLLVAINEGRLRRVMRPDSDDTAERLFTRLWSRIVEPALESWIDAAKADELDMHMREERVAVVNFRHRMHVRTVVPRLLEAWTPPLFWEDSPTCRHCPAQTACPMLANAVSLREADTRTRTADVMTAAHYSGQRLPFRRLQGVLATMMTGGIRCSDVQRGALSGETASALDRLRYRFYDALFHRENVRPVAVRAEPVSRAFAMMDAGLVADYSLDQEIEALASQPPGDSSTANLRNRAIPPLELDALRRVRSLMSVQGDQPARGDVAVGDELARLARSLRRWAALTGKEPLSTWYKALQLLENYVTVGEEESLRHTATAALNRLHRHVETRTETLSARQVDPAGFRNPARLALELDLGCDFNVRLRKGPELPVLVRDWLEACASEIDLEAWPATANPSDGTARLRLDLRLVAMLLGVREGYVFLPALGAYRQDLARFHSQLVALASRDGRRPTVTLRVGGASYKLSAVPAQAGQPARLRFEGAQ